LLSNQAVQLTPLARLVGWARFARPNTPACWQHDHPQPSGARDLPMHLSLHGSAARALPGSCLLPWSSTLHTPASGAADRLYVGRRARTRAPWWRDAPGARLRGRVRTRRRRPPRGRRRCRCGFNRRVLATAPTMT